jgi:hypothetical protein
MAVLLALVAGLSARGLAAQDHGKAQVELAPASLAAIEEGRGLIPQGGEFLLYRWDVFPSVLVFDLSSFVVQDRMFSRLAFFLEKRGYRGRLLTDAQLAGKHGWNAHDYGAEGLASFFSKAAASGFRLDAEELALRDIALREGIVVRSGPAFAPGAGAVLSICRSSSKYERILLLAHESYHGIFFCSSDYRDLCESAWAAAPEAERSFVSRLLAALGYDETAHELAVNEYQAYLLQQPAASLPAYFERVSKLLSDDPNAPDISQVLPGLERDEAELQRFLESRYSISAGGQAAARAAGGG